MSRRITLSLWLLAGSLTVMTFMATGFGALRLPVNVLWSGSDETLRQIWLTIRLPRVLLALVIGGSLALAGCVMQGVPTLLDADVTPQDIAELIALSDHAAFSAPGLRRLTQRDETEDALKKAQTLTNGHVYVTQGRDGCFWLENETLCHQPGFEVNVIDTTGAGDVFHGALAVSLGQKLPAADAVRFASAVAALKCTKPGGRAGIPDCDQTRSFLSLFV